MIAPDVSSIVTEDDTPVDTFFSEKQRRLLTEPIYTSWEGPPPEEDGLPRPFVAAANVGVFGALTEAPVVPDVLLSVRRLALGVTPVDATSGFLETIYTRTSPARPAQ